VADIVTIGEVLVEIMAEHVGQRFDEPGRWLGPYPSGAPAILADQAARCGARVALIGCVGDDPFGQLNRDRLLLSGVDVTALIDVPVTTGCAFVTYRGDGGRDFVYHIANSAAGALRRDHVRPTMVDGCRWFHVMGSSLVSDEVGEAILHALALARRSGARLSLDPNARKELLGRPGAREMLDRLVAEADLLLASEEDLEHLAPGRDEASAVERLLRGRATQVVVKRGARGCASYVSGEAVIEQAAFTVDEIDPTGAGDCFGGTFLARLLDGCPTADGLRDAAAAGAMAVRERGPMQGNTTSGDIAAFIAQAEGR